MYSPGMMGGDINQALQSLRQAQGARLPPRLQRAVAGGMDPAAAQARFARFQAGQLPGQAGGQSLGTPTPDPGMNPGGAGMQIQSMPMGPNAPSFQGGYGGAPPQVGGASPGTMAGAVGDMARQLPNRPGGPGGGQLQQLAASIRGARGRMRGGALNPNGAQPRPVAPAGGLQSMTEVLNGPDSPAAQMGGSQVPPGMDDFLQQANPAGGAMNAKPLFGAQGIPQGGPPARRLQGIRQGLGAAVRGAINR